MSQLNGHLILAAGSSKRFQNSINKDSLRSQNKFLFPFLNAEKGCLIRLIDQIHENFTNEPIFLALKEGDDATVNFLNDNGINYVEIIYIKLNSFDNNCVTLLKLIENFKVNKAKRFFIWEADIFVEHKLINQIKNFLKNKSFDVLATTYNDQPTIQEGGFLTPLIIGNENLKKNLVYIGKKRNNYDLKLFGLTVISANYFEKFFEELTSLVNMSPSQYFHYAFIDDKNVNILNLSLNDGIAFSFNTKEQLENGINQIASNLRNYEVKLIPLTELKHIELFSKKRVQWLKNKITSEKRWIQPIIIDIDTSLIMDGQHRFEVAKMLNFSLIPCVEASYDDLDCWSLRDQFSFNSANITKNSKNLIPFPYKTVKHDLDRIKWNNCDYSLEDLK